MKRILLLSGYDAQSHRQWRNALCQQFNQVDWTVLALTDRHFSWRMGGNALNFISEHHSALQQSYDLILATSMTDLCGLFGLMPHLADVPSILYFHENQLAYPSNKNQPDVIHYQLSSIKSAMAAKRLIFNSNYNKESFLTGVKKTEHIVPDGFPRDLAAQFENKSQIIPVPLADGCFSTQKKDKTSPLTVVWNHRWEHDKGPETLLQVLRLCQQKKLAFKFNVIGQQFRQSPDVFDLITKLHADQINQFGYIDSRNEYLSVLRQSDVVLSTALHEFQGLAVMEAVAAGCLPLVPDRLAYRDFYPVELRYTSTTDTPEKEAQSIVDTLMKWQQERPKVPNMHHLSMNQLAPQYENILLN